MPPRLLALDFDGVVSDSAPESFVVALLTYSEFFPDSHFGDRRERISVDRAPSLATILADPLYETFLALMPLGNRAEDFGVALRSVETRQIPRDQRSYDRFRDALDPGWLPAFHERFYEVRSELSARDEKGWSRLMGPYPELIEILRRRHADAILTIATAKDRRSVEKLLRDYGISDLFPDGHLLDKETGVHKDTHLRALHERFGVPYAEMTFVDDKLNHLETVAALGVNCGLAGWGYNGTREVESARQRGFPVFELATVEGQLFG